jgi:hypothetical protein
VTVAAFTLGGLRGANVFGYVGRIPHRKPLAAGSYRLTATPTDSSGRAGDARTAVLNLARKKAHR